MRSLPTPFIFKKPDLFRRQRCGLCQLKLNLRMPIGYGRSWSPEVTELMLIEILIVFTFQSISPDPVCTFYKYVIRSC